MSDKIFKRGDLIFAKMRGYPAWPARIEGLRSTDSPSPKYMRYKVFFFGTYETATVKGDCVFDYTEKKEKYGTPKKNFGFNKALWEIENKPNIGPPVCSDSPPSPAEQPVIHSSGEDSGMIKAVKREHTSARKSLKNEYLKEENDSEYSDMDDDDDNSGDEKGWPKAVEDIRVTMSRKQAEDLLALEEMPNALRNKLSENLMKKYIVKYKRNQASHVVPREAKIQFLLDELKLMNAERRLKELLTRSNKIAATSEALALLEELEQLQLSPLMVKKQPNFVELISKLCRYVGCVEMWNLTDEVKAQFESDAKQIRKKAVNIFYDIQSMFEVPPKNEFLPWFKEQASLLRSGISSSQNFMFLTHEPMVVDLDVEAGNPVQSDVGNTIQIKTEAVEEDCCDVKAKTTAE